MTARDAAGRTITLDASILGRDYKIACKEHERAELAEAIAYLDRRMREIRDQGKVTGADRIAVMAALNITHDLLRARGDNAGAAPAIAVDGASAQRKIREMGTAIDQLLAGQEKLF
jgi:cell division protein ZapA